MMWKRVAGCGLLLIAVVTGTVASGKALPTPDWKSPGDVTPPSGMEQISQSMQGWDDPVAVEGERAELDPRTMVVGVKLGQEARAYVIPPGHLKKNGKERENGQSRKNGKDRRNGQDFLIRDTMGDRPLTVAFSGRDAQIVVFRWLPNGHRERVPHEVMRWRAWRKAHPESPVVTGQTRAAGPDMAAASGQDRDPA